MLITDSEARAAGPRLRRDLVQSDVKCPAGTACGGRGVVCGIEQHFIAAEHEAHSLVEYCLGNFIACSTWRAEKERIWAQRKTPLIEE